MSTANLVLRFLLELAALIALGFWGAHAGATHSGAVMLALASPLAAAALWGAFVSPKARYQVTWPVRLGIELIVFGAAIAGFVRSGEPTLALALGCAVSFHEGWRGLELCLHARRRVP